MKKKKQMWKNNVPMILAVLLPLFITGLIALARGVYPFGNQCLLHVDMYHQYCPFFTEMMEKIKEGGSFLYSWKLGLGADFIAAYAYYLSSPLNWFLAFCPPNNVIEFMTILILLKIAVAGGTFGFYLKEHFGVNDVRLCVFATAYALSGFVAAYSWNIMWMDSIAIVPLIVLGLERLMKNGNVSLYTTTLAISIISNYYISIIICIFLVLYFFLLLLEEKENRVKGTVRFAGASLLAGGMGAVLIIPEAILLGYASTSGNTFPDKIEWYFNIVAELARSCFLTEVYIGKDHWPNLYCGAFALLFLVLYWCNRQISWKKKLPRTLLLFLFVVSFANNMLDFIWHGFHFPNSLPGRQSFLFLFLLLTMCYEGFISLTEEKAGKLHLGIAVVTVAVFLLVARIFSAENQVSDLSYILTFVLVGAYTVLLFLFLTFDKKMKQYFLLLLCGTMTLELGINFGITGFDTTSRTSYVAERENYKNLLEEAEKKEKELFYRVEELERKTKNDAAFYQYPSVTLFSSLLNINVSHFYQKVGMEGGKNFYCMNGATPLFSAMLSVRYVLADNALEESPLREFVAKSGDAYLYQNRYVLPLGFLIPEEVIENWDYEREDEIEVQNQFATLLGAREKMLEFVAMPEMEITSGKTTFETPLDGCYYAVYTNRNTDRLVEKTSDGRERTFTKCKHGYTLELGYCKAGTTVTISNSDKEEVSMKLYRLNEKSLETAIQTLNLHTFEVTQFSDTEVEGKITVQERGRLVFSIPKEEGWTLYVDGKKTESEYFGEAFLSVHLTEGTHRIRLKYQTPGLKLGAGISAGSLVLFVIWMLGRKKKEGKKVVLQKKW